MHVLVATVLALVVLVGLAVALKPRKPRPRSLGLGAAAATFALDQASKLAVLEALRFGEAGSIAVAPFLDLTLVWNRGVSYGLFAQEGAFAQWLLVALALGAGAAILIWMLRVRSPLLSASLGLILGGAAGNAVDRVAYGAVVDFVHLHWEAIGFSWYVFNVADAAIVVGVVGLLIDAIRPGRDVAVNEPSD